MAHHNIATENEAAQNSAAQNASLSGAASTPGMPDETPFDRAPHESEYSDEAAHDEEPLWRKLLLKLRQLIGFE